MDCRICEKFSTLSMNCAHHIETTVQYLPKAESKQNRRRGSSPCDNSFHTSMSSRPVLINLDHTNTLRQLEYSSLKTIRCQNVEHFGGLFSFCVACKLQVRHSLVLRLRCLGTLLYHIEQYGLLLHDVQQLQSTLSMQSARKSGILEIVMFGACISSSVSSVTQKISLKPPVNSLKFK